MISTKFGNAQHAYMLTLSILFVLFFLANSFGESGALTALVFGLMIGNKRHLSRILRFKVLNINYFVMNAEQTAFDDNAFDLVVAKEILKNELEKENLMKFFVQNSKNYF